METVKRGYLKGGAMTNQVSSIDQWSGITILASTTATVNEKLRRVIEAL